MSLRGLGGISKTVPDDLADWWCRLHARDVTTGSVGDYRLGCERSKMRPERRAGQPIRRMFRLRIVIGGVEHMHHLWRDFRYTLRSLARVPALSATIVLTVGIGLGATTAMIGVVRAVLVNSPPVRGTGRPCLDLYGQSTVPLSPVGRGLPRPGGGPSGVQWSGGLPKQSGHRDRTTSISKIIRRHRVRTNPFAPGSVCRRASSRPLA